MKLGKTQKTNQFLESLKAEGEVILEDAQPSAVSSRSSALPPSDPVTVTIEEKLNVVVKRDGGIDSFDVQGTLALQVLNDADGFIQLQVMLFLNSIIAPVFFSPFLLMCIWMKSYNYEIVQNII